ncbi:hypothetical protein [Chromohalobacter moromii]|uniref:Uncharacterized protein n=1 Tax=Chromohalobacter moromii TaxID=2860329 RepID=A0A9X2X4L8_9GAMM|nr:hypothetical protein [Chromohalobacter moromii]MCT8506152.1 hypothetical protein [Chromohalobacter moromii]
MLVEFATPNGSEIHERPVLPLEDDKIEIEGTTYLVTGVKHLIGSEGSPSALVSLATYEEKVSRFYLKG